MAVSKKSDLKKSIAESEEEIRKLESKRMRSQSALLEAILNHQEPSDIDVEYFKMFTSLIDLERDNLIWLNDQFDNAE